MATSLTRSIIAALLILVAAASVSTAAAAGGGNLRRHSQVAAAQQPSNNANAAAAAAAVATPTHRRRKLEDKGYAGEWSGQYSAGDDDDYVAHTDDLVQAFFDAYVDDDQIREVEVATVKNFWSMFNSAPRYWDARQWGFFAGVVTLFSIVACCMLRIICPCC